ncbi:hypothetical protein Airi01_066410 [Actinoallomurus iriomotensis]|uniref:Uncharacterized protein n=1 Tax=Actinoallomurus iriomotensis TaxID=478107 RepID=A0A9W6RMT7_9ACTN|nr:hypothetical protein Airi01_066410 [Actinoallomurus iriomotensis]
MGEAAEGPLEAAELAETARSAGLVEGPVGPLEAAERARSAGPVKAGEVVEVARTAEAAEYTRAARWRS